MNVIFLDFDGVINTYMDNEVIREERLKILAYICKKYDCKVVIESTYKDLLDEDTLEVLNPECEWLIDLMNEFKIHGIEVIGRTPCLTSKYHFNRCSKEYIDSLTKDYYNKYYYFINQLERLNKTEFNEEIKPIYEDMKRFCEGFINKYPKLSDYLNERMYSKVNIWKEDEIRIYLMRHPEIEHYVVLDDDDLGPRKSDLNKVRNHLVLTGDFVKQDDGTWKQQGLLEKHIDEVGKVLQEENEVRNYILRMEKKKRK